MSIPRDRNSTLALVGLLAVAICWGSSFPLTKNLFPAMSAIDFVGVRFPLAGGLLLVCFFPHVRRLGSRAIGHGVILGAVYGVAQIMQTSALEHTSASISGFITGSYVVLTPLLAALLFRHRVGKFAWLGAGLSAVGLAALSLHGLSVGGAELVTLASSVIYALHILGLSRWSTAEKAIGLAVVQMVTVGVVCFGTAVVVDRGLPAGPPTTFGWVSTIYMVVVSGAVAMIVQSWAQAHLAPTRAAIAMATEPVWAATLSVIFLSDPLTWRFLVGGVLMLAAIAVVEVLPAFLSTASTTTSATTSTTTSTNATAPTAHPDIEKDPAEFYNPTGSHL